MSASVLLVIQRAIPWALLSELVHSLNESISFLSSHRPQANGTDEFEALYSSNSSGHQISSDLFYRLLHCPPIAHHMAKFIKFGSSGWPTFMPELLVLNAHIALCTLRYPDDSIFVNFATSSPGIIPQTDRNDHYFGSGAVPNSIPIPVEL